MGKTTKPSASRLAKILTRQDPCGWGADYIPSITATREEAPAISRATQIWWEMHRRYVHVLSDVEQWVTLICLFHPWLFELQEQRMLHYLSAAHPLDSHPKGAGVIRPALRGTLEVSNALQLLKYHAMVAAPRARPDTPAGLMPFPWVGDLLLFLDDGKGPYCVNLTIKHKREDFDNPPPGAFRRRQSAAEKAQARHRVESLYYLDADIPTVRLTLKDFDMQLPLNLAQILLWSKRKNSFSEKKTREIVNCFKGAIGTNIPAMSIVHDLARVNDCKISKIKIVLHQALWSRQIRIDLFQPFLIDKPLLPEKRDPFAVYGHWFVRG